LKEAVIYTNLDELLHAYLHEHLQGRASQSRSIELARQWLLTLPALPTRRQILERHLSKGKGHYEKGATQANNELALLRAACRWGMYQDRWQGGDPTAGIKKWKTAKRKRVAKFQEIPLLLRYFARAITDIEIRDRALYGLMLFTGCRPSEARTALVHSITPYGEMGCWQKGKTKNGETYEVPIPKQLMPWIAAWKAIRPTDRPSEYLFPGQDLNQPISMDAVGKRWHDIRLIVGLPGLWNYDLRRSMASHMSNELDTSDAKIDAILGHEKTSSLGHYLHVSFDAMTEPIQAYAEWLMALLL
jgi:integrase/recombinase XerD